MIKQTCCVLLSHLEKIIFYLGAIPSYAVLQPIANSFFLDAFSTMEVAVHDTAQPCSLLHEKYSIFYTSYGL